jgi:hypothetical protein
MPTASVNGVDLYYGLVQRADLATVSQPTLIVSAEDSPEALRLVRDRLAEGLPAARSVLVTGGHLINPAQPAVLSFIEALPGG